MVTRATLARELRAIRSDPTAWVCVPVLLVACVLPFVNVGKKPFWVDEAMTVLFRYTEFHDVGFNLFLKFSESKLSYEEEEMLKALGVRF